MTDYARNPIQNLAKLGLVSGKPGCLINSKGTVTHAEFARVIYILLKHAETCKPCSDMDAAIYIEDGDQDVERQ